MLANNIKISELNKIDLSSVSSDDFFPLVDSGSMTTYRLDFNDFGKYFFASGSVLSASHAATASYAITSSYTFQAEDSFYAEAAVTADRATTLIWPNNASAHYATQSLYATHSISSSYALTASYSFSSSYAVTASFALDGGAGIIPGGSYNISCSYASASMSASYALSASKAESASYAFSASNSDTASYALAAPEANLLSHPGIAVAWALVIGSASLAYVPGSRTMYNPKVVAGYNIRDDIEYGGTPLIPSDNPGVLGGYAYYGGVNGTLYTWNVRFATPMSHTNYTVLCGIGGEQGQEYLGMTVFAKQVKSIYGFTMSCNLQGNGGFFDGLTSECDWFNFVVYANPSTVTNENGAIYTGPPGAKGDKGDTGDPGSNGGGPTFLDVPILVSQNTFGGLTSLTYTGKVSSFSANDPKVFTLQKPAVLQNPAIFYCVGNDGLPANIKSVILDITVNGYFRTIYYAVRKNSSDTYRMLFGGTLGNWADIQGCQGTFPIDTSTAAAGSNPIYGSFQYGISAASTTGNEVIRLIGYY